MRSSQQKSIATKVNLRIVRFFPLVFLLAFPSLRAWSQPSAQTWIAKSNELKIGSSIEWKRVLLFVPRWFADASSVADEQTFFNSPDGMTNSEQELAATIGSFFAPWSGSPDDHPVCRFPRRLSFIEKALGEKFPQELTPSCPAYQRWRADHPVDGISLVFASNYLNNPASLYGHTFLRLHRKRGDGTGSSPLLDYAVNFAANPTTENPILYPLMGLTGRFFGTFSLMPYYIKVQEYNNAESRDLFEYNLNFSDEDLDNFMKLLWEAGPHGIRYWYMDENCSFILLTMIAGAKTDLDAADHFPLVVSPKDTLLVLKPSSLLGDMIRRPSAQTRLNVRRSMLSAKEVQIFNEQIRAPELIDAVKTASSEAKVRLLDALIEWISWEEKLAGSMLPVEKRNLWTAALTARSQIPVASVPLDLSKSPTSLPEQGHKAHRVHAAIRGQQRGNPELVVGVRLSLHEYLSPVAGYSSDQEITMIDVQASAKLNHQRNLKLYPEKFTLVRILSVPNYEWINPSPAWTLSLESKRAWGFTDDSWMTHRFSGGVGLALGDKGQKFKLWFIPQLSLGQLLPESGIQGAWGILGGTSYDPSESLRLSLSADLLRVMTRDRVLNMSEARASISKIYDQKTELRWSSYLRRFDEKSSKSAHELSWMLYF